MKLIDPSLLPAIVRGIKEVGIGKHGSRSLSSELVSEIVKDINSLKANPVSVGAFLGAMWFKGFTGEEESLKSLFGGNAFSSPEKLLDAYFSEAPSQAKELTVFLLNGNTLSVNQAEELGDFLFSNDNGDALRGLIASYLRVRYETDDEYEGLLKAITKTLSERFRQSSSITKSIIQLAEPFDGMERSYLLSPLIANFLQAKGYIALSMVGRTSGPKFGPNLKDLAELLSARFLKSTADLSDDTIRFGLYIDQKDLSSSLDHWVDIRKLTIKRPFLATLEKFINPIPAKFLITSAFHGPYTEKMSDIADRAGFEGSIVIRKGQEGSLTFPLSKTVEMLCSVKQVDGSFKKEAFELSPMDFGYTMQRDERIKDLNIDENAMLIKQYAERGYTDDEIFNLRANFTLLGIKKALSWLEDNLNQ